MSQTASERQPRRRSAPALDFGEDLPADRMEIGWLIRNLRRSRRQPHNGRPWTQDDLAVVVGTDTGHISRIEQGGIFPSRPTLERIASALELTPAQQLVLLGLAGYTPEVVPPTEAEIEHAVAAIDNLVRDYWHPVTVITGQLRLVYANPLYRRVLRRNVERFGEEFLGKTLVEIYARTTEGWPNLDIDPVTWHWMNILRVLWDTSGSEHLSAVVRTLARNEPFGSWWRENALDILSGRAFSPNENVWYIDFPGEGRLQFHRWWGYHPEDRRFIIRQDVPADLHTRQCMRSLSERESPAREPPS
jgi:transcriptional regulator with XRE-family HTH domain